ncbi:MAG TPA: protein kinase [Bryobacteraceae bacterium]|nr:protein kinase [Bryobacteraceae bacterium]
MIRTVGNYKLLQELGEGAMGTVYRALDMQLEREVALKSLRSELARRPDIVERFREEAKLQGKLENIHIVRLYQFLREGTEFFMVMEFVKGKTLSELLRERRRLAPNDAITIMDQALAGLGYAHKRNIVHRDIKPANIMINEDEIVKVADFGIARLVGSARQTKLGSIVGTLEYISPEAVQGNDATAVSDIYSCGILLYELLSGRLPFDSPNEYELARAQVKDKPPALRQFAPEVPTRLEKAVMKALAKKPADRFQSAAQMAQELKSCLPGQGGAEPAPEKSFWNKLWSSSSTPDPDDTQVLPGLQVASPEPRRQSPLLEADDTSLRLRNTALQELSRQIDEFLNQRNWTRARQEVEKMTVLYPREPALVEMSNRIAREQRHYEEALQMALREARNLLDRGLPEAAKKAIELSLQRFPAEPDLSALLLRADAELAVFAARSSEVNEVVGRVNELVNEGRHPEAISAAAEAVARFPNQPEVTALLGRAVKAQKVEGCRQQVESLRKTSQWDAALAAIDQTLALYREEPLLAELRQIVLEERECEQQSKEADGVLTRASELQQNGQPDEAESAVNDAIGRLKKAAAPVSARLAETSEALKKARHEKLAAAAIAEARSREKQRDWHGAIEVLNGAMPRAPGISELERVRGEIEQARDIYVTGLRDALASGRALLDANRFEDALVSLSAFAQKYPGEPGFTGLLLETQQKLTVERRERQLNAARAKAAELLANESFEETEQFLLDAISQFPDDARLTDLLSAAIQGRREQEKKRMVERAIGSAKQYASKNLYEDAIHAIDEALAVYPAEPSLESEKRELAGTLRELRRVEQVRELGAWEELDGGQNFDAARAAVDAALADYPGDAELTAIRDEIETARRAFARSKAEREVAERSAELESRAQYDEAIGLADAALAKFPESESIAKLKQGITARREQAERLRRSVEAEREIRCLLASGNPHTAVEPMRAALAEFPEQDALKKLNGEVAATVHDFDAHIASQRVRDALAKRDWGDAENAVREFEGVYSSDTIATGLTKEIAQAKQARKKALDDAVVRIRKSIEAGDFENGLGAIDALNLSVPESEGFSELAARAREGLEDQAFQRRFQELRDKISGALDRGLIDSASKMVAAASAEYAKYPGFRELEAKVQREREVSSALDTALEQVGARQWATAIEFLESKIKELGKDRRFDDLIAQIQEERKRQHEAAEKALADARALFEGGQHDRSIQQLTKSVADFPDEQSLAEALEILREKLAAIAREARHKAAESALVDAEARFGAGQYETSIQTLTNAVAMFPEEPALGEALKKFREQHAVILRAARHRAAEAALAEARTLFESGQHDAAIEWLTDAAAEFPDEPALAETLKKYRKEIAAIARKIKVHELEERARSLLAANKAAGAEVLLESALQDLKGEESLEKLLEEVRALRRRAEDLKNCVDATQGWLKKGNAAHAEAALQDGLRRFPDEPVLLDLMGAVTEALLSEALAAAQRELNAGRLNEAKAILAEAVAKHGRHPKLTALGKDIEEAAERKATIDRAIAVASAHLAAGKVQEALAILDKLPAWVASDLATIAFRERCQRLLARHKDEAQKIIARADGCAQNGLFDDAVTLLESASADPNLQPALQPVLERYRKIQLSAAQQLVSVRQTRAQAGPSAALEAIRQAGPETRRHPDFDRLREQYERELTKSAPPPTRLTPVPKPPAVPKPTVVAPVRQPAQPPVRKFPPAALWGGLAVVGLAVVLLIKSLVSPSHAPLRPNSSDATTSKPATPQEPAHQGGPAPAPAQPERPAPNLVLSQHQILADFRIPIANPNPPPYRLIVSNDSGTLTVPTIFSTSVVKGQEWLSASQELPSTPTPVWISLHLLGLKVGSYEGLIRCTPTNGRSATITVNLTIHPFSIQ